MIKTAKSDLVESLSIECDLSVKEARKLVDTMLLAMSDALSRGDGIELRGFGSFKIKQYDAYSGRNPKTGESITVEPKKLPVFKPGKHLQRAVNESEKLK